MECYLDNSATTRCFDSVAEPVSYTHLDVRGDRKSLKSFSRQAAGSGAGNTLASAAAGIGMGLLGIGIPDIPLLTGMMLRSIYETALHYGFS